MSIMKLKHMTSYTYCINIHLKCIRTYSASKCLRTVSQNLQNSKDEAIAFSPVTVRTLTSYSGVLARLRVSGCGTKVIYGESRSKCQYPDPVQSTKSIRFLRGLVPCTRM